MNKNEASFEDGLLMCLNILEISESKEDAKKRIVGVLNAFREVEHDAKLERIRDNLGVWQKY